MIPACRSAGLGGKGRRHSGFQQRKEGLRQRVDFWHQAMYPPSTPKVQELMKLLVKYLQGLGGSMPMPWWGYLTSAPGIKRHESRIIPAHL